MQFKDLAEKLADQCSAPLEGTVIERQNKKDAEKKINTFVLRTTSRPIFTVYRKNLRTDPAEFLQTEVPAKVLENIQQKLAKC